MSMDPKLFGPQPAQEKEPLLSEKFEITPERFITECRRIISECDKLLATTPPTDFTEKKHIQKLKFIAARLAGDLDMPVPKKTQDIHNGMMGAWISAQDLLTSLQNNPFKE